MLALCHTRIPTSGRLELRAYSDIPQASPPTKQKKKQKKKRERIEARRAASRWMVAYRKANTERRDGGGSGRLSVPIRLVAMTRDEFVSHVKVDLRQEFTRQQAGDASSRAGGNSSLRTHRLRHLMVPHAGTEERRLTRASLPACLHGHLPGGV